MLKLIHKILSKLFGREEMPESVWYEGSLYQVINTENCLTQPELQTLCNLVSYEIFEQECMSHGSKRNARSFKANTEQRDYWYKQAGKHSRKIKKLAALQHRLKYKIKTSA